MNSNGRTESGKGSSKSAPSGSASQQLRGGSSELPSSQWILDRAHRLDFSSAWEKGDAIANGSGAEGQTYLCRSLNDPEQPLRCVKRIRKDEKAYLHRKAIRNEVNVLIELNKDPESTNIIDFIGAYEDQQHIYIVMEYGEGGDLCTFVEGRHREARGRGDSSSQSAISEEEAKQIFLQVSKGIACMHANGFIHGDLKLENVVWMDRERKTLKIVDFGMTRFLNVSKTTPFVVELGGTTGYIAPETLLHKSTKQADLWSLGVMVYVLLAGDLPFKASTTDFNHAMRSGTLGLGWKVEWLRKENPEAFENSLGKIKKDWKKNEAHKLILEGFDESMLDRTIHSEEAKDVVRYLLKLNPAERPTIRAVLDMPWIKDETGGYNAARYISGVAQHLATTPIQRRMLVLLRDKIEPYEMAMLKQTFKSIDTDGDEVITLLELKRALEGSSDSSFYLRERLDADTLFANLDNNGDQSISIDELMQPLVLRKIRDNQELLYELFQKFDDDKDGELDRDEVYKALANNELCDEEDEMQLRREIDEVFCTFDVDLNGKIDLDEFISVWADKPNASMTRTSRLEKNATTAEAGPSLRALLKTDDDSTVEEDGVEMVDATAASSSSLSSSSSSSSSSAAAAAAAAASSSVEESALKKRKTS